MADNKYHQRIFILNYNQKTLPKFETNAELDAWHQAVGRMVCYGLIHDASEDCVELVVGQIADRPLELCCAYYPTLLNYPEKWEDGSNKYMNSTGSKVEELARTLKGDRHPFVIGAILHSDGVWGYHS